MALRTLPEELCAPIAAPRAHVGIEIEHRVTRKLDVAAHQRRVELEGGEGPPNRLVDGVSMRIVGQGLKEKVKSPRGFTSRREVLAERQAGAPVLGVRVDEPLAEIQEAHWPMNQTLRTLPRAGRRRDRRAPVLCE